MHTLRVAVLAISARSEEILKRERKERPDDGTMGQWRTCANFVNASVITFLRKDNELKREICQNKK